MKFNIVLEPARGVLMSVFRHLTVALQRVILKKKR